MEIPTVFLRFGHTLVYLSLYAHRSGYKMDFLFHMPNFILDFGHWQVFPIVYAQSISAFWALACVFLLLYPIHSTETPCENFPQGVETFLIISLPEFSF